MKTDHLVICSKETMITNYGTSVKKVGNIMFVSPGCPFVGVDFETISVHYVSGDPEYIKWFTQVVWVRRRPHSIIYNYEAVLKMMDEGEIR